MKTSSFLISLFLLLCQSLSAYAQSVSVELSTRWVKTNDLFLNDSILHFPEYYPELIITYRNNSDTNYYFQKVSDNRHELPIIPSGIMFQYPIEEISNPYKELKCYIDFSEEYYKVWISGSGGYTNTWSVMADTINIKRSYTEELINHHLSLINNYIYRQLYRHPITPAETKIYFSETEITPEMILDSIKEKFVFLKPNEVFVDRYNLIAFSLLNSNFSFFIYPTNPCSYVIIEPVWNDSLSRFIQRKMSLPQKVGDYNLYSGYFNTNELSLFFGKNSQNY